MLELGIFVRIETTLARELFSFSEIDGFPTNNEKPNETRGTFHVLLDCFPPISIAPTSVCVCVVCSVCV